MLHERICKAHLVEPRKSLFQPPSNVVGGWSAEVKAYLRTKFLIYMFQPPALQDFCRGWTSGNLCQGNMVTGAMTRLRSEMKTPSRFVLGKPPSCGTCSDPWRSTADGLSPAV